MSFYGDEPQTDATETRRKYTQSWGDKLEPYAYAKRNDIRAMDAAEENVWFYRDRCGTIRGPAHLQTLRQCWVGGVVDEHTMMWGNGLGDWIPARNIRGLIPLIRNPPTIFMSWIVRKFVDTDEKIRALRAQRFSEGLAKSDTLDAEGVSKWDKKRRAELKRQGKVLGSLTSRVIPRVTKSDVRVDFK